MARAKDPRVVQVMAGLASEYDVVLVARADGTLAADVRPLVRLSVTVIAEQNGRREMGSAGGGGRFGLAYFDDRQAAVVRGRCGQRRPHQPGVAPRAGRRDDGGAGPGWPGVLLHEAVGHGLEGDFNRKGSSAFSGRIGQRVAAKGVTVLDDGTIADRRGSLNVDDEGNASAAQRADRGRHPARLHPGRDERAPDGRGAHRQRPARELCAHPMPRMTNTYMLGGDKDPKEIVASIDRRACMPPTSAAARWTSPAASSCSAPARPTGWKTASIQYPVKGATIVGNGPDALKRVSMIGNDMRLDTGVGTCGKEGQSVPVGVGQPTLRIDEGLTVGGTA
jgi:TldD protein